MDPKRLLDLGLTAATAPLWMGATAGLAAFLAWKEGGPVFFVQPRVGQGLRPFRVFKLRTMTTEADVAARRPTKAGAFLREHGWDELPQLWNVLKGDMSIVGPRPRTPADADRLCARHPPVAARFAVKPGLTGLAQVRQTRGVEATAAADAAYAQQASVALDLSLIARTLWINLVGKRRARMA
jgi:lipopolysaccharide/colanic/teichoic acid biosynthesis glycosyltransferase